MATLWPFFWNQTGLLNALHHALDPWRAQQQDNTEYDTACTEADEIAHFIAGLVVAGEDSGKNGTERE